MMSQEKYLEAVLANVGELEAANAKLKKENDTLKREIKVKSERIRRLEEEIREIKEQLASEIPKLERLPVPEPIEISSEASESSDLSDVPDEEETL